MEPSQLFLLAWAALLFWVLGQIWLVQIVVYPLFAQVGEAEYVCYHRFYSRRIPLPVIIPGFASFLLPIALALYGPAVPFWMSAGNVATGIVGLLVTVLLEIPRHTRLELGLAHAFAEIRHCAPSEPAELRRLSLSLGLVLHLPAFELRQPVAQLGAILGPKLRDGLLDVFQGHSCRIALRAGG